MGERESVFHVDLSAEPVSVGPSPLLADVVEAQVMVARRAPRRTDPSHLLAWMTSQRHGIDVRKNLSGSIDVHWAPRASLAWRQVHQGLIHAPTRGVAPRASSASTLVREKVVVESTERRARAVAVDGREHMARPEDACDCAVLPGLRKGSAAAPVAFSEVKLGQPNCFLAQHALQLLPQLLVGVLAPGCNSVRTARERRDRAVVHALHVVRVVRVVCVVR